MSEEKFTKGEWALFEDRVGIIDRSDSQSYGMMNEIAYIDMYDHGKEQGIANAHLIAAAPEMYAMLKKLRDDIDSVIVAEGHYFEDSDLDRIDQLLAEARGEK